MKFAESGTESYYKKGCPGRAGRDRSPHPRPHSRERERGAKRRFLRKKGARGPGVRV
jgi:hypothetical protein